MKTLLTSGKEPDAQAAFEVANNTLIAALAGARIFRCGGLLTSAEVYSAEQLVIVKEIIEYIKNLLKKQEFSEEQLMADEIADVKAGDSFISRKSTMKYFKREYWEPEIFIHSNLGQWRDMGEKSMWDYANERAKKMINEHTYSLDDDRKRELNKIFEKAKTDNKLIESFKF
jgi:trimethylamine--corrinoid protein Co-methyltransferase